jgi:serine protease Do
MRYSRALTSCCRLSLWASLAAIVCTAIVGSQPMLASDLRNTAVVKAVEGAKWAVVNIHGHKTVPADSNSPAQASREVNGMGTGVLIDTRGYILTNFHVVDGVARIQVTTAAQKTSIAELIARDPATDLAVIKIPADPKLHVIPLGTSSDLMVGEPVIAMGNAFGYNHSVTRGIVSALHRDVPISETQKYFDLIQTDASINPGNSGGPLLNIDGEMIGLNVAVRVGAQGIGFAIPVDQALEIAARLIHTHNEKQGYYGVAGETKRLGDECIFRVTSVDADSPAAKAGIESDDIITGVGDTTIKSALDFELAMIGRKTGDELLIEAVRGGEPHSLRLAIGSAPDRRTRQVADSAWDIMGLRLTPAIATDVQRLNPRYRGGMRVIAVRAGSPAERQNIKPNDILVGMHVWETVTMENVGYVLSQSQFDAARPVKCFILRDERTHYTYLPVTSSVRR